MITVSRLTEMLSEEIVKAKVNGLDLIPIHPTVKLKNSKTYYGLNCKSRGNSQIYISKYYLNAPEEELRSVICHEVCHSVKGSRGHDAIWRRAVMKMRRNYSYACADYHLNPHPYSTDRSECEHTEMAEMASGTRRINYVMVCTGCGCTINRTRMSDFVKHPENYYCRKCHGKFERKAS